MENREAKRIFLIENTAKYVLKNGLYNLSLRPLAVYLNTSDRMLLHYFENKDELILLALQQILIDSIQLVRSSNIQKVPLKDFLKQLPDLISNEIYRPIFNVWLELATYQNTNIKLNQEYIENMVKLIHEWIYNSIEITDTDDGTGVCNFVFIIVEGMIFLNAYGLNKIITSSQDWILKNLNSITD